MQLKFQSKKFNIYHHKFTLNFDICPLEVKLFSGRFSWNSMAWMKGPDQKWIKIQKINRICDWVHLNNNSRRYIWNVRSSSNLIGTIKRRDPKIFNLTEYDVINNQFLLGLIFFNGAKNTNSSWIRLAKNYFKLSCEYYKRGTSKSKQKLFNLYWQRTSSFATHVS